MSLGQNIKRARNKAKLSQEQLATKINMFYKEEEIDSSVGNTAVSNWENGLNKPDPDTIRFICKITNVDPNTLLEFNINDFDNADVVNINTNIIKIPVYGTIKAGIPIESQSDIIDYIDIPDSWIKGNKKFFGLRISGDSMFPKYNENDIVIFEQNDDIEAFNGKDCAVMINGSESTFKKVIVNEQGILLQPYNTSYDIMMYSRDQVEQLPIKIAGIARELRRKS